MVLIDSHLNDLWQGMLWGQGPKMGIEIASVIPSKKARSLVSFFLFLILILKTFSKRLIVFWTWG